MKSNRGECGGLSASKKKSGAALSVATFCACTTLNARFAGLPERGDLPGRQHSSIEKDVCHLIMRLLKDGSIQLCSVLATFLGKIERCIGMFNQDIFVGNIQFRVRNPT